jgi:hypothetical protein
VGCPVLTLPQRVCCQCIMLSLWMLGIPLASSLWAVSYQGGVGVSRAANVPSFLCTCFAAHMRLDTALPFPALTQHRGPERGCSAAALHGMCVVFACSNVVA